MKTEHRRIRHPVSQRRGRRLFHQVQDRQQARQLSLGAISKVTLADAQAAAKRHFALIADKKFNPSTKGARATAKASDTIKSLISDFMDYLKTSKKPNGEKRSSSYLKESKRALRVCCKGLHRFSASNIDRKFVAKELSKFRTERGPIASDRSRAAKRGSFPGKSR